MNSLSQEYIKDVLQSVARDENLEQWKFSSRCFDKIAQNYFGVLIPIVLEGTKDNRNIVIKLVIKFAPIDERYRVSGAITLMFAKEIFVYSKVLSIYEDIQKNFQNIYVVPKCYLVREECCKEVIVLQDMCDDGYHPYAEKMFLDFDHIKLSLTELAKFHALSFLLKNKDEATYNKFKEICVPLNETNNKRFIEILKDRLDKALLKFEETKYVPLLLNLKEYCVKLIENTINRVHDTAICHGDIWKENIMFKYEGHKPVSSCIIDYQTVRMCSPAYDVLYLITSSTDGQLRSTNYQQLIDHYYEHFDSFLKQGNLNASDVYSKTYLEEDLRTVSPACLIIANTALWLSNGLQEEGHVRSKKVFATNEEKQKAVDSYKEIMGNIIEDFYSYGYLNDCCI